MKQRSVGFFIVYLLAFAGYMVVSVFAFSIDVTVNYADIAALQCIVFAQLGMMALPIKGIPVLGEPVAFKLKGDAIYYGVVIEHLYNGWFRWSAAMVVSHIERLPEEQLIGKRLTITDKMTRLDSGDNMWVRFYNRIALIFSVLLVAAIYLDMPISISLLGGMYVVGFLWSLFFGIMLPSKLPKLGDIATFRHSTHIILGRVSQVIEPAHAPWQVELEVFAVGSPNGLQPQDALLQNRRLILQDFDQLF